MSLLGFRNLLAHPFVADFETSVHLFGGHRRGRTAFVVPDGVPFLIRQVSLHGWCPFR
jgi:hypothetical protein